MNTYADYQNPKRIIMFFKGFNNTPIGKNKVQIVFNDELK